VHQHPMKVCYDRIRCTGGFKAFHVRASDRESGGERGRFEFDLNRPEEVGKGAYFTHIFMEVA